MTYIPHVKVTWSGIFGNPTLPFEQWSFGLAFAHDDGSVVDISATTAAADLAGFGATFIAAACSTSVKLTLTKVANINAAGHYSGPPQTHATVPAAGTGSIPHPPQIALVVSTRSTPADFPRVRGRFFVPGPLVSMQTDTALITDGDCATIAGAAKDLIDAINGDFIAAPGHVVIASNKGAGRNAIVHDVRVGHVLDTVRSRRRSMKEAYTEVAV